MTFFRENKAPLLIIAVITLFFALLMLYTFTIVKPGAFLSALNGDTIQNQNEKAEYWRPLPLSKNFFSFFTSGVSLSMFAPNSVKILAHPAILDKVKKYWPIAETAIFILNAFLFWFVYKNSPKKERVFILFLIAAMFVTISEVIIARPDHSDIPDFDYRYAGASYYFYSIFIALSAAIILRTKEYGKRIVVPAIIIVFALQQVFSFHALRLKNESAERRDAFVRLDKSLLNELSDLEKNQGGITIPNLAGGHIYQAMSGYTLADYLLFFNKKTDMKIIQNIHMPPDFKTGIVKTAQSLRTETSPEFKESLKKEGGIRSYYSSPAWMIFKAQKIADESIAALSVDTSKKTIIKKESFDPEKMNAVVLNFYTDDTPGTMYLYFSFRNDFGLDGDLGEIRIDDYTPYIVKNGKRVYSIETNMLQVYAYSLSEKISDFYLNVPESKNVRLNTVYLK